MSVDTIIAPAQDASEKGQYDHGIVATLCDDSHFHLVFNQRLDADLQPEQEDFSLFADEQKIEFQSLSLKSGVRNGEAWSLISFSLRSSIKPGTPIKLKYHPRQFFLWSEELDEPIESFELLTIAADADTSKSKGTDLRVNKSVRLKENENPQVKTEAHIAEACEHQIRIALNHILEAGQSPKIEDFSAESDTRYLNLDSVYVTRVSGGAELILLLREVLEPNTRIKVAYKPGRHPLRTLTGELLKSFNVEAMTSEDQLDAKALADIDHVLDLAKRGGDDKLTDESNVISLFEEPKVEHSGDQQIESAEPAEPDSEIAAPVVENLQAEEIQAEEIQAEEIQTEPTSIAEEESASTEVPENAEEKVTKVIKPAVSEPVEPQKVILISLEDGSEQKLDPREVFARAIVENEYEEQDELDERSLAKRFMSANIYSQIGAAVGAVLLGWGLFVLINFSILLFSIGVDEKPKTNLMEQLATKSVASAQKLDKRKACEHNYENGAHFKGSCLDGKRDGGGTYMYANGDRYSGEWVQDLRNGNGMVQKKNGELYAGTFKEDKMHGKGIYRWPNGGVYEGEFVTDKFHGQGTLVDTEGRRFEGRFENGNPIEGTCFMPDGSQHRGPC